jgi:hypothetical protein
MDRENEDETDTSGNTEGNTQCHTSKHPFKESSGILFDNGRNLETIVLKSHSQNNIPVQCCFPVAVCA